MTHGAEHVPSLPQSEVFRNSCLFSSWQDLTGHAPRAQGHKSLHHILKLLVSVAEEDGWIGNAWPCYALPVGLMILCYKWVLPLTISGPSLRPAQCAEDDSMTSRGPSRGGTTSTGPCCCYCGHPEVVHPSALWMGSSAPLPSYSHNLYAWMYIFLFFHRSYTCVLVLRTAVCFLTWISTHMWMFFSMCSHISICMFSVWQLPTPHYWTL